MKSRITSYSSHYKELELKKMVDDKSNFSLKISDISNELNKKMQEFILD